MSARYEAPTELGAELIKVSTGEAVRDAVKAVLLQLAERRLEKQLSV